MRRINKFIITAITAVTFLCSSAMAFEGLSVGIIGMFGDFNTTGTEYEGGGTISGTDNESTAGTASATAEFPAAFIEYSLPLGNFGATIGIEYVPGTEEIGAKSRTDANTLSTDDGTYSAKAEVSDHVTAYFEPTISFNDNLGIYLKGGVSHVTVNSLESLAIGGDSSTYGNDDVWGVMYGVGLRAQHESGAFIKAEASKTEYGTVTLRSSTGNQNLITADPEVEGVRIALGYNF